MVTTTPDKERDVDLDGTASPQGLKIVKSTDLTLSKYRKIVFSNKLVDFISLCLEGWVMLPSEVVDSWICRPSYGPGRPVSKRKEATPMELSFPHKPKHNVSLMEPEEYISTRFRRFSDGLIVSHRFISIGPSLIEYMKNQGLNVRLAEMEPDVFWTYHTEEIPLGTR